MVDEYLAEHPDDADDEAEDIFAALPQEKQQTVIGALLAMAFGLFVGSAALLGAILGNGGKKANKDTAEELGKKGAGEVKKRWWLNPAKAWHDKRATQIFGTGKGRHIGGRHYDKRYKGKDVEFKSDNFRKGPRTKEELDRMTEQIKKDIQNKKAGTADPYWHFDHDPRQAPEMGPLLDMLDEAGIPWTVGTNIL